MEIITVTSITQKIESILNLYLENTIKIPTAYTASAKDTQSINAL